MEKYLENSIVNFARLLREGGIAISTSEVLDALRVISYIDMTDRKQFYQALLAVMVKNNLDIPFFNTAFDAYFVGDAIRLDQLAQYMERKEEVNQLKEHFTFKETSMDISKEDLDVYASMPEEAREKIKKFIQRTDTGTNVTDRHQPMLERVIQGALDYHRAKMKECDIIPVEATGDDELDSILYNIATKEQKQQLYFKDMASIHEDEVKDAVVIIRQLARVLATRIGRRYKQSSKVKSVDIRRSMANMTRYGGVLMELKYRHKKVSKPNIVLLSDVSGSMLKYTRFLLQMMMGLSAELPNIQSFVFSEHIHNIDLRKFNQEEFGSLPGVGEGTNINQSLFELMNDYGDKLSKRTVVVILSDTKTLELKEAAIRLKHLNSMVRGIIWLNPMEKSTWNKYPGVGLFKSYCYMYESSSLQELSRALNDI